MTEYLRAGFGGGRGGAGGAEAKRQAEAEKDALKSRPPGTHDGARASEGVYWTPAHKDAGSRQNGWELLRERLKNVMKSEGPRLFVFDTCCQFIRTVPVLPRDEIDMDDVDRDAEDHVAMERGIGC